jgi:hypothetical protein
VVCRAWALSVWFYVVVHLLCIFMLDVTCNILAFSISICIICLCLYMFDIVCFVLTVEYLCCVPPT